MRVELVGRSGGSSRNPTHGRLFSSQSNSQQGYQLRVRIGASQDLEV